VSEKKTNVRGASSFKIGDVLQHVVYPGTLVMLVESTRPDLAFQAVGVADETGKLELGGRRYEIIPSYWRPFKGFKQQLKELLCT